MACYYTGADDVINVECGDTVVTALLSAMKLHQTSLSVLERAVAFLKNVTWAATRGCETVCAACVYYIYESPGAAAPSMQHAPAALHTLEETWAVS